MPDTFRVDLRIVTYARARIFDLSNLIRDVGAIFQSTMCAVFVISIINSDTDFSHRTTPDFRSLSLLPWSKNRTTILRLSVIRHTIFATITYRSARQINISRTIFSFNSHVARILITCPSAAEISSYHIISSYSLLKRIKIR